MPDNKNYPPAVEAVLSDTRTVFLTSPSTTRINELEQVVRSIATDLCELGLSYTEAKTLATDLLEECSISSTKTLFAAVRSAQTPPKKPHN